MACNQQFYIIVIQFLTDSYLFKKKSEIFDRIENFILNAVELS